MESFADADQGFRSLTESQMDTSLARGKWLGETMLDYIELGDITSEGLAQLSTADTQFTRSQFDEIMGMTESEQATAIADLVASQALERFNRDNATAPEGGAAGGGGEGTEGRGRRTAAADRDPSVQVNLIVDGNTLASALFEPGSNGLLPQIMEGILREGAGANGETVQTRS